MTKNFNVDVEPQVIEWAIKSSGYSIERLSRELDISQNLFNEWFEGKKQPTLKQVEQLSKYLKRPLAAFFLPKPPEEKPLPKDYRMIPGKEGIFDPKTILAIRTARRLQEISKELSENLNHDLTPRISFVKMLEDPKKIADDYRNKFQITEEIQKKWKDPNKTFNVLRELIEKQNIFVFQISMSEKDVSGFALSDDTPPVIVVNSKEQIKRRIFTLMHEFGHILLKNPGIDVPENGFLPETKNIPPIEKWCNEFASAFLLPESIAMDIFNKNKNTLTETETLNKLSNNYKVSKAMLLYNMRKLNYITDSQYKEIYKRPQKEKNENKSKGWPLPDNKCISQKGKKFISLVSENVKNEFITDVDAFDYLSIKSKEYDKILQKINE